MTLDARPIYRALTRAQLDLAYDNRAAVHDSAACLARWAQDSASYYRSRAVFRDLRYGTAPRQRLDFFPAERKERPTLVFVHGGYWQWCDKEDEAFVARGPAAHGINVVNVEYTLCPDTSIDGIVADINTALDWLVPRLTEFAAHPDQLILAGSSAGAHLAAMMLARPDVKGALLVSGIYDLEPVWLSRFNQVMHLDLPTAQRNSPILRLPTRGKPVCFAVGADELPEMVRQSRDYCAAWRNIGFPSAWVELSGVNHFTIMDELAEPEGRLTAELLRLIQSL
jgi:arylformamidase